MDQEPQGEYPAAFSDLRAFRIFQHIPDEQLAHLAAFATEELIGKGQAIYEEGKAGEDFYVVLSGLTEDFCTTMTGRQLTGQSRLGQLLGELSFLDGRPRPCSAAGVEKGMLLRIDAFGLRTWLASEPELGVGLARSFWHSLAAKIRQANQFLAEMVPVADAHEPANILPAQKVEIMPGAKMSLFEETGLSAAELRLLATTLHAQRFTRDAYIFREGESGQSLYIVFEGEVRISRQTAARGEEPLAILSRGDVFGEMALVDDQLRSADARAHADGCTVLVLSQADLDEVLHMPPLVASQFLYRVCGVLCHRLRSMISLLASWRIRIGLGQEGRTEGG